MLPGADACAWPGRVMVAGAGPSARYAHVLAMVANRFLVASGGNDGKQTLADAWALDTSEKPYHWKRISEAGGRAQRQVGPPLVGVEGVETSCGSPVRLGTPLLEAHQQCRTSCCSSSRWPPAR